MQEPISPLVTMLMKQRYCLLPYPFILVVVFTLIQSNTINAQNDISTKPNLSSDVNIWYDSTAGLKNTVLHVGVFADMTKKAIGSHPYFVDFRWQKGQVTYRDQIFEQVYLIYNIENDILLTKGDGLSEYDKFIQLNKPQVLSFHIAKSFFKQFDFGLDNINSGFYEVLFEGESISFIARHRKLLKINLESEFEYVDQQEFFIVLKNNLYPIKNTSDLANLFKADKKSIKSLGKQYKLKKLSYESYSDYIAIIDYCDELASQL